MTPQRETLAWLEPRLREVPEELAEAIRRAVRRVGGSGRTGGARPESGSPPGDAGAGREPAGGVPGLLARAAVQELDRVLELPQSRATAVRLLAADASLTYAFEAASDLGEDAGRLADAVGVRGAVGKRLRALGEARETGGAS